MIPVSLSAVFLLARSSFSFPAKTALKYIKKYRALERYARSNKRHFECIIHGSEEEAPNKKLRIVRLPPSGESSSILSLERTIVQLYLSSFRVKVNR